MTDKLKIGFVDYYIDEWHANNYPRFIRESAHADDFTLAYAWQSHTLPGKKSLEQWCADYDVTPAQSVEQLIDACDAIVVLAPSDPQMHETLADLPLRSGKPVYIDKTFADSLAAGQRLFDKANAHGSPMFSSSALRFATELNDALAGDLAGQKVHAVHTRGGGNYREYMVHQLEMIVVTLGLGAQRVLYCGNDASPMLVMEFADGRRASLQMGLPFSMAAMYGQGKSMVLPQMSDFFPRFIDAMLTFFKDRQSPVPPEQTLQVMALIEAGLAAQAAPDTWVNVPQV